MGAWTFLKPRFENLVGKKVSSKYKKYKYYPKLKLFFKIHYCGRDTLPVPAVGVGQWHHKQAEEVTSTPFIFENKK